MKLEFGGGETPRKPDYLQVDVRNVRDRVICCEAWKIADVIKAPSVTDIYSRHFFEHLTHDQAKRTLDAWRDVCVDDARVEMIVPNMEWHLWQWNNWPSLTEEEKDHCRAGFWGWQREGDDCGWDLHKSGYDYPKLRELVYEHEFRDMRRLQSGKFHLAVEFYR